MDVGSTSPACLTEKPKVTYDRPGFSLGGPVVIPGLYNGHDKTFAFGAVEWLYDEFPEPGPRTVPSLKMRNGDFSELLAQNIQIYDPATAQQVGARVVRTAFPGNIIPANRLSPIAQQLMKYYPEPNQAGNQGTNNYFSANPRSDTFYSVSTRVDHQITDKQRMFVRYTRNNRRESRGAYFGTVNGVVPTGNFLYRINDGVTADHVYTMSSSSVLDLRAVRLNGEWDAYWAFHRRRAHARRYGSALPALVPVDLHVLAPAA